MDLKEFEKILRTETGEELETEEIRKRKKKNKKIDRGESAKLKKISRSVAMIARMNF